MDTYIELWDTESGNLLGDFADLAEAIGYLKMIVAERGPVVLTGLFLLGDHEDSAPIADDELLELVIGRSASVLA